LEWSSTCAKLRGLWRLRLRLQGREQHPHRGNGQSFNWADFVMHTEGTFPNVTMS
jgi:hypothetical protein